jgi:hypothetical protein
VTRSGHFNPGCKEAPPASQGVLWVLEGIASREGVGRVPQTLGRQRQVGVKEAPQRGCGTLWVGLAPVISRPGLSESLMRAHGCRRVYSARRTQSIRAKPCLAAGINTVPGCGPQTPDDAHLPATRGAAGDDRLRGDARHGRASARGGRPAQQAERVGRERTAGMEKAAVTDCHAALREAMVQEPAEKLQSVAVGGSWTAPARLARGARDGAVLERDDAALGESDPEERGSQGGEGSVAGVLGLTMDVPGDGPDCWGAVLPHSHLAHGVFAQSAGEQGEGFDRATAVRSGGQPRCAVR